MSNLVSRNGQADCPQRESSLPENGILYRQSSDKAETKQKNQPTSPTPSFEKVKSKISNDYERWVGRKITWREGAKAEEGALQGLVQSHTPTEIVLAHRKYLETADEWSVPEDIRFAALLKKWINT